MPHETSIRLPGRLVGVVRADAAAVTPLPSPTILPAPPTAHPGESASRNIDAVLSALRQAALLMQAHRQQQTAEMQRLAVELAVAVASRFLQGKVSAGDFPFEALIRQALDRLETRQPATVMLHADDLAALQEQLPPDHPWLEQDDLRLIADTTLPRGACKVRAQDRCVHFDLEERLETLRRQLLDAVADAAASEGNVTT
jgi:flagellar biosynthesis/type III secretory pathway protein FliH